MSRHVSLAAALATVAVIVPAGWRLLRADIEVDGRHLRPLQQTLMIDGVKVTLDVDRSVVTTGDKVKATLVATSDVPETVSVDLRALHSSNYAGERVEQPWTSIDRETLRVTSAPGGGKPVVSMIQLGKRLTKPGLNDSFQIMVAPHGTKVGTSEYGDDENDTGFSKLIEDGKAAAIAVRGWSGNNLAMTIEARDPVTLDKTFTIAVRVKNTSGKTLPMQPYVDLSTEAALAGTEDAQDQAPLQIDRIDNEGEAEPDEWKRGAEEVVLFRVTPHTKAPKQITFLANAIASPGPGPTMGGALDAKTFDVVDSHATVAKK